MSRLFAGRGPRPGRDRPQPHRRPRCIAAGAIGKCASAVLALSLALLATQAQSLSSRPVRIIVGTAAGGSLDIQVRIIGKALGDVLGQEVVIEDRPGGSGVIAGQAVANAAPDGHTLFAYGGDLFTVSSLMPRSSFDPNKQLSPLAQISDTPLAVVTGRRTPFGDVKGLIAAAKASSQSLTYGTFAVASVNNLAGQWIAKEAGIKLLNVTYRSGNEAALAAAAGNVTLAIVSPAAVYPALINAGTVKLIGLTGKDRPPYLPPSWPTFAQSGIAIDATTFFGLFGPVGVPDAAVARLDRAIREVLQDYAVRTRLINVGIFPQYSDGAAFAARIHRDANRYNQIIHDMHMSNQP